MHLCCQRRTHNNQQTATPISAERNMGKWHAIKVRWAYGIPTTIMGCFFGALTHFVCIDYSTYMKTGQVNISSLETIPIASRIGGFVGATIGFGLAQERLNKSK